MQSTKPLRPDQQVSVLHPSRADTAVRGYEQDPNSALKALVPAAAEGASPEAAAVPAAD